MAPAEIQERIARLRERSRYDRRRVAGRDRPGRSKAPRTRFDRTRGSRGMRPHPSPSCRKRPSTTASRSNSVLRAIRRQQRKRAPLSETYSVGKSILYPAKTEGTAGTCGRGDRIEPATYTSRTPMWCHSCGGKIGAQASAMCVPSSRYARNSSLVKDCSLVTSRGNLHRRSKSGPSIATGHRVPRVRRPVLFLIPVIGCV